VGVEKTLADGIWILVGVGISVVSTVVSGPPSDRPFNGATADSGKEDLERQSSTVGAVSPEAMVT
jgi:hypothetical protein